jgi:hypothetical protein
MDEKLNDEINNMKIYDLDRNLENTNTLDINTNTTTTANTSNVERCMICIKQSKISPLAMRPQMRNTDGKKQIQPPELTYKFGTKIPKRPQNLTAALRMVFGENTCYMMEVDAIPIGS